MILAMFVFGRIVFVCLCVRLLIRGQTFCLINVISVHIVPQTASTRDVLIWRKHSDGNGN